jgi:hypothetical protein
VRIPLVRLPTRRQPRLNELCRGEGLLSNLSDEELKRRRAFASTHDVPLKPVDDAVNEFRELYKRWDNRLTLKNIDIAERYIKSGLQLLADLHIRGRGDDIDLRAIVHRADETVSEGYCNPALKGSCHVWYTAEKYDGQNELVFVGYVEVMDRPERFIPSFVRFQRLDYSDDIWAGAVYLSLLDSRLKVIPFGREGKIDALDLPPVEPNKIACQQHRRSREPDPKALR